MTLKIWKLSEPSLPPQTQNSWAHEGQGREARLPVKLCGWGHPEKRRHNPNLVDPRVKTTAPVGPKGRTSKKDYS